MNKENLFEYYFRLLTLLFWPIICYKWIFIQNITIESILFITYTFIASIFIIFIIIDFIISKDIFNINLYYRVSTIISYILTLCSFLLYPTNIPILLFKFISIIIYFYFSSKLVFKFKNEEGVVGIISSLLLIAISICY